MTGAHLVPVKRAAECNCEFDQDPAVHDRLLRLEEMPAAEAATFIAEIIINEGCGGEICGEAYFWDDEPFDQRPIFSDCHDFGRFVASHNWEDPAAMASLAMTVDQAAEQAKRGRLATERRRAGTAALESETGVA